jgi:hypothetical protein
MIPKRSLMATIATVTAGLVVTMIVVNILDEVMRLKAPVTTEVYVPPNDVPSTVAPKASPPVSGPSTMLGAAHL